MIDICGTVPYLERKFLLLSFVRINRLWGLWPAMDLCIGAGAVTKSAVTESAVTESAVTESAITDLQPSMFVTGYPGHGHWWLVRHCVASGNQGEAAGCWQVPPASGNLIQTCSCPSLNLYILWNHIILWALNFVVWWHWTCSWTLECVDFK